MKKCPMCNSTRVIVGDTYRKPLCYSHKEQKINFLKKRMCCDCKHEW